MLLYQALRGLTRSFSSVLPARRSHVHFTSFAVKGLPSCHLTPWRSGKRSSVPSSLHDQLVARSGTIDCMLFCAMCWSKTTRLLKTPIIGRSAAVVDSSCSDMLAGLSKWESCRMPPAFWAIAGLITVNPSDSPTAAVNRCNLRVISPSDPLAFAALCPRLADRTIAWQLTEKGRGRRPCDIGSGACWSAGPDRRRAALFVEPAVLRAGDAAVGYLSSQRSSNRQPL